jgi:transcriptional regulator with XRE-family HTH domain
VRAGELLREVRSRHGLTQRQLAARGRTSQAAISRIERGLVSPSVDTLAALLDLMGEELELTARRIDDGRARVQLRPAEYLVLSEHLRARGDGPR